MKKIFLIRHGQTEANNILRFQGHTDNTLNELGLQQAEKLGRHLSEMDIKKIYTSDLTRTLQTAAPAAKACGLTIEKVPALKEISFGKWEGLTQTEIKAKWPETIDNFFKHPASTQIEGGESFAQVQERAWQAFQKIVAEQEDNTSIAIVSHGGIVRTLICSMLELNLDRMWSICVDNVGVCCILEWENSFFLKYVNDTAFLKNN